MGCEAQLAAQLYVYWLALFGRSAA